MPRGVPWKPEERAARKKAAAAKYRLMSRAKRRLRKVCRDCQRPTLKARCERCAEKLPDARFDALNTRVRPDRRQHGRSAVSLQRWLVAQRHI